MSDTSANWLLVDGSSLIFRAYYAVPPTVRASKGTPVNAIRGFLDTLARLVTTRRPTHIAIARDVDWRPAWRVALIPGYKAHRTAEPVPPLLIPQLPVIEQVLDAVGIDHAGVSDYEAEDVIAGWTAKAPGRIEIASGDRDLFALVESGRITVLYPERSGLAVIDEDEVARRYGIPGRSYADFAVLRGDPSDGLPGLKGVGAVAAAGLINRYGGATGVLEAAKLSDEQRDYLSRAIRVVRPLTDLSVELPPGRRDAYPVNTAQLDKLTTEYALDGPVQRILEALRTTLAQR